MKLNLGCGRFPLAGHVNVDADTTVPADVFHELDSFPYPFESGSATHIVASHVLEHLQQPLAAMVEWARILKPGGRMLIRVPHFSRGFMHPDHRNGFDVSLPLYFDPRFEGGFTGTELLCRRVRLRWFAQPWLKRRTLGRGPFVAGIVLGSIIDLFANLSVLAASRLWGFWVGGFEEVEFELQKPDPAESSPA